jgi:subtilisin family serine protease
MRTIPAVVTTFLVIASLAAETTAAEAVQPSATHPHVPGRVVARLSTEATGAVRDGSVPEWLARYGVIGLVPVLDRAPGTRQQLEKRFGLDRLFELQIPGGADVVEFAERLGLDERVEYAHPDWIGQGGDVAPEDTSWSVQWSLNNTGQTSGTPDADIDAPEAWRIATGRRETLVAVLDSGIDGDHPAFWGRIGRGGRDEVNTDFDPEDDHGHGTSVTGITAARTNDEFSVAGIDWHATILPVKVLNSSNSGTTTDLIDGIDYAANVGADVVNMSLIRYPNNPSLADAVAFADAAGVLLIGCNGNDGTSALNYPASYPEVLATGWTNQNDLRSGSSNFTTTLDVVAPGVSTRTVSYDSSADTAAFFSGCSAATPHAAGVVSVLLALDPTLTFVQVRDILRATADDEVGNPAEDIPGRDDYYGWGRISMELAIDSLGLVSRSEIHVGAIDLRRELPGRLVVRVEVLDDLTGAEPGVQVDGSLTLPDTTTLQLSSVTAASGVATLVWEPGGNLPTGAYTFSIDGLSKQDFAYDPESDLVTSRTHDPDLNGLHVGAIEMSDDGTNLLVEVQVLDDDDVAEGGVTVTGTVTPPQGGASSVSGIASWAAGGWARLEYTRQGGVRDGLHTFDLTSLEKTGFIHETARDTESSDSHTVLSATGDEDGDGNNNASDNCPLSANPDQADADGDGHGDACDVCPGRPDPAQTDADGDGTGDRCDCAPFDGSTSDLGEAWALRFDDGTTLSWNGVAGADVYDVSRGALSALDGSNYGACLAEDAAGTSFADPEQPPPGDGFFYLVRGDDAVCGAGTTGVRSDGTTRVNANSGACGSLASTP